MVENLDKNTNTVQVKNFAGGENIQHMLMAVNTKEIENKGTRPIIVYKNNMKKKSIHIILLISATLLFGCSYASPAVDSLPACILKMMQKDSFLTVDKFDYKGQQWFSISRILTLKESQISDRMYQLKFYNDNCQLICTWTRGGIAGFNKVSPDSIDKTKIIKVAKKVLEKIPAVDSIPACILKMKQKDSLLIVDKYDYRGQQWFGISPKLIDNDKMFIIKFYNTDCKLVGTWHGAHNQVVPDSIDKTRILNMEKVKVPEAIFKLAVKHMALSITEYEYLGQTLYLLNVKNIDVHQTTITEPYFDKDGRDIITFQRATSGAFLRAQRWEPYNVDTKKLIKKGIIWYNLQTITQINR
ncbi:MAG: hypothetical protein ABIP79_17430 [Chitinophagaceae bacterium]